MPFLNDTAENIRGILSYCREAGVYGVLCFGIGVTLREGDREYFYEALDKQFPGVKNKYIKTFGYAYECRSPHNDALMKVFYEECNRSGLETDIGKIFQFINMFEREPPPQQLSLFDDL